MVGGSYPTCVLCTHNGHIRLPFSGADREVRATLFFHAAVVLRISAEAWCHGGGAPQKSQAAPPPPLLTIPLPQQRGHSPLLPFPWHGAVLGLRTQTWEGTSNRHRGEHSPQKGPESAGPSRAPLPPPARAAAAGASRARRPAGKMADGPGWLVTRGRCWKSAIPGPNLRLGMEAQTPSERTPGSITALGTGAACVSFYTSP